MGFSESSFKWQMLQGNEHVSRIFGVKARVLSYSGMCGEVSWCQHCLKPLETLLFFQQFYSFRSWFWPVAGVAAAAYARPASRGV